MNERAREGRQLLQRWAMLLTALVVVLAWATCRMNAARVALNAAGPPTAGAAASSDAPIDYWTCTMHPDVREAGPGDCPICGMTLVPKYAGSDTPGVKPDAKKHAEANPSAKQPLYMCTMPECNDTPSTDPTSRCPVCGMKRERIDEMDVAGEGGVELTLSERARRLAEVATEPITQRRLFRHIRTVGIVNFDETRHKMVTAWIGGRIDRLFADYTGMVVSQGDHLVDLYSPDLVTAQEEYLTALRGVESLGAASATSRERSQRLVQSAERQLELLGVTPDQIEQIRRERKSSTRLTVHAPIGGTIVRKPAMEGMYVKTGEPLYEIADLDSVWILLELYESDLPWIAPLQRARLTTQAMPGEEFSGQIAFINPIVDRQTRTISVRVNAMNRSGLLKPGMFVNAELFVSLADADGPAVPEADGAYVCPMHPWESADAPRKCAICEMTLIPVEQLPGYRAPRAPGDVLAVPREAVLETGERALVYEEVRPGTYVAVEIAVGPLAEDSDGRAYYPVLSGIGAEQRVVTRGNFAIDSQMQIAGKPSLFNQLENAGKTEAESSDASASMHSSHDTTPTSSKHGDGAQAICPVMGNEIDPEVFAEVGGVRVYFCCPPCIKRFQDDPEKYLDKLPARMAAEIRKGLAGGG